jgi:KAP family P-loop domain
MAEVAVDENLRLVVEDLSELRGRLVSPPDQHAHERLLDVTSGYLLVNKPLIERAVEAWAKTPEKDLEDLQGQHRELDGSATRHSFHDTAMEALSWAELRRGPGGIPDLMPIDEDDLHMLDRVLRFSKYLVDASNMPVRWHPVRRLLEDDKALAEALEELEPPRGRDQVEWVPDAPATEDLLNRRPLADALARRLRRVARGGATGSFLIHLDGAWGAGKSSILNFLREELEAGDDPWLVVDFNAWQQARLGPAWWTLITVLSDRMTRDLRVTARWRLRGAELWQRARRTGAPYALALVVLAVLVAAIVLVLKPAHPAASAGDVAKTVTAVVTALGALWTGALFVSRFLLWRSPAGARVYERSNENPMADLKRHFGWLVWRVGRPVAFFVDDLDRCEQTYVVEFLDAVQTLVRDAPVSAAGTASRSGLGPYFVVAADGGWIRASYDTAYATAIGTLVEPGQTLGHLFLDKMFQLTVTVPSLSGTRQAGFLEHLLKARGGGRVLQEEKARVEARIRDSKTQAEVRRAWESASRYVQDAVAPAAVARLTDEEVESETEHELQKFSSLLDRNPRRTKRFLNVYTVDLVSSGLEGNFVEPDALALWTILRMRWPTLSEHLRANPESVKCVGDSGSLPAGLAEDMKAVFELPEVAEVVTCNEGGPLTPELVKQLTGRATVGEQRPPPDTETRPAQLSGK